MVTMTDKYKEEFIRLILHVEKVEYGVGISVEGH